MTKREFVMLAHKYEPLKGKHNVNGWYISEKLDGQRALWLPFTRGDRVTEIPFANRERDTREHIATGLWSRYGKPIFAPDWFLDKLPKHTLLDGELYIGRGLFQTLSSYIRKHPEQRVDEEWKQVRFCVFDAPTLPQFLRSGRIFTPNYKMVFDSVSIQMSSEELGLDSFLERREVFGRGFESTLSYLQTNIDWNEYCDLHAFQRLPFSTTDALARLDGFFGEVLDGGGEGVILRKYSIPWEPVRSHSLLKMKPVNDSEAIILGFTLGIGKLDGLMGALVLSWRGEIFEVSGFTDQERELVDADYWFKNYPVKTRIMVEPEKEFSKHFKVGDSVTFSYRELTNNGIPKEARYLRKRPFFE